MVLSPRPGRQARRHPDVRLAPLVGASRTRPQLVLSRSRVRAGRLQPIVAGDWLPASGTPGGGDGAGRQGRAVRLQDVRAVRAQLHRHVLSDELPEAAAQWSLRRSARRRPLRGASGDALRVGGGGGRSRAYPGRLGITERRAAGGRPAIAGAFGLAARGAGKVGAAAMRFDDEPVPGYPLPILPGHTSPGRLERVLRAGQFAITTELAPPDSADPQEVYDRARVFDRYVDAINATDGSGANCHMSSLAVCALLTRVGYAPVMQISCRDRNRIAIQGDILGGAAMGVCNVLCLSGDGVQAGDHPQAKPVFDLDAVTLLETARTLRDEHRFLSGRKITFAPRVFLGAAENPSAKPLDYRAQHVAKKVAAGAQFIQTQYCYDLARLRDFMRRVEDLGLLDKVFILVGIGPLRSAKTAEWMRQNVPGLYIPDAIVTRLGSAADPAAEGRKLCIELIQEIRTIKGVHG